MPTAELLTSTPQDGSPAEHLAVLPRPPVPYSQLIVWTPLPAGFAKSADGQKLLRIHVHVAPRLQIAANARPDVGSLRDFPDFANWPKNFGLNGLSFTVDFRGDHSLVPDVSFKEIRPNIVPDADLWRYLIPPNMPVISYVPDVNPDEGPPVVQSDSSEQVYRTIRSVYTGIAIESPIQPPNARRVLDPVKGFGSILMAAPTAAARGPIHASAQKRFAATEQIHARLLAQFRAIPPDTVDAALAFHQLSVYNSSRSQAPPLDIRRPNPKPQPPGRKSMADSLAELKSGMDFHKLASFVASYPLLQKRLGFVLELLIPAAPNMPLAGAVRVTAQWTPRTYTISKTPETFYQLTTSTFLIQASRGNASGIVQSGMLNMQNGALHFHEIDVSQAGLNIQSSLNNILIQEVPPPNEGPAGIPEDLESPLPSLREGGLSVNFTGRAQNLSWRYSAIQSYEKALRQQGDSPLPLTAEDVVRGYRVDIQDITDTTESSWLSLFDRIGYYTFAPVPQSLPALRNWNNADQPDEGFVQLTVTKAADGSARDLYLSERMFRWLGWSLAVPRPGKTVNTDDTLTSTSFDPNDPQSNPYGIGVRFVPVPHSLPRLRFGHTYRLRARAVDLAGYSLSREEASNLASPGAASAPVTYLRFSPIDAPVIALTDSLAPSETAHKLVIRSNYKQTVQQYSTAHPGFRVISERHIGPPITTAQTAETIGMFDSMPPAASWSLIDGRKRALARDATNNMVDKGELMTISYLPDPLARGPAFLVDPQFTGSATNPLLPLTTKTIGPPNGAVPVIIDFYPKTPPNTPGRALGPAWADAVPLRLRIVDPASVPAPSWDAEGRVLSIPVPQGRTMTLRLSSYPTPADLDQVMGIWSWIKAAPQTQTAPLQQLAAAALQGLQWMLTPYQELTLVHAVQQPLMIPDVSKVSAFRDFGQTTALAMGEIPVDGNSTGKVDVFANWQDPVDDVTDVQPKRPFPKIISGSAHFEVKLSAADTAISLTDDPSQVEPASPDSKLRMIQHEFHDTKYHSVQYAALASSRYADYFPGVAGPFVQTSPAAPSVDVLSTARPAAPSVLYVIPSFSWRQSGLGASAERQRITGLRVYLERPWFSSGAGELLGVVLWPNRACPPVPPLPPSCLPGPPPPKGGRGHPGGTGNQVTPRTQPLRQNQFAPVQTSNRQHEKQAAGNISQQARLDVPPILQPYITQWGRDPLWLSSPIADMPGLDDFKNPVAKGTCLTVEGLAGVYADGKPIPSAWGSDAFYDDQLRVCVAGYEPVFDGQRNLWLCDIAIDPPSSYFPFIRLALARFQPHSLQGRQLLPDQGSGCQWASLADVCLSHIVRVDFAQIAPNRTLSLAPVPGSSAINVTLTGFTYFASPPASIAQTSTVEISLEFQSSGHSDDAGWVPVGNTQQPLKLIQNPPHAVWQGQLSVPSGGDNQQYRLIIKEFELIVGDLSSEPVRRLVYADAVNL